MVGYCSPDTAGGILKAGVKEIKIMGDLLEVNARIASMDSFSAHGDRKEMMESIKNQKGKMKKMFLVHGEYDTQLEFVEYLSASGFNNIVIPSEGQDITI